MSFYTHRAHKQFPVWCRGKSLQLVFFETLTPPPALSVYTLTQPTMIWMVTVFFGPQSQGTDWWWQTGWTFLKTKATYYKWVKTTKATISISVLRLIQSRICQWLKNVQNADEKQKLYFVSTRLKTEHVQLWPTQRLLVHIDSLHPGEVILEAHRLLGEGGGLR